jgi:ATP phosphoribosyltransferase
MESVPQFISNHKAWEDPWKRRKMERILLLLRGAMIARNKVGLKMNLPEAKLGPLLEALPALRNPTVSRLAAGDWVAVETIIDETVVRELIPELKALGAEGIIEYPLNKVVF